MDIALREDADLPAPSSVCWRQRPSTETFKSTDNLVRQATFDAEAANVKKASDYLSDILACRDHPKKVVLWTLPAIWSLDVAVLLQQQHLCYLHLINSTILPTPRPVSHYRQAWATTVWCFLFRQHLHTRPIRCINTPGPTRDPSCTIAKLISSTSLTNLMKYARSNYRLSGCCRGASCGASASVAPASFAPYVEMQPFSTTSYNRHLMLRMSTSSPKELSSMQDSTSPMSNIHFWIGWTSSLAPHHDHQQESFELSEQKKEKRPHRHQQQQAVVRNHRCHISKHILHQ